MAAGLSGAEDAQNPLHLLLKLMLGKVSWVVRIDDCNSIWLSDRDGMMFGVCGRHCQTPWKVGIWGSHGVADGGDISDRRRWPALCTDWPCRCGSRMLRLLSNGWNRKESQARRKIDLLEIELRRRRR